MLAITHLHGFTEDVTNTLGPVLGKERVLSFVRSLETKIRTEAEAGARKAIPDIRTEVAYTARKSVTPIVAVSAVVGLVAGVGAAWAFTRWRK